MAAIGLFVLCVAIALFTSAEGGDTTIVPPVIGLAAAALAGSALIGVGSLVGLIGRRFATPGKFACIAFVIGWVLLSLLPLAF